MLEAAWSASPQDSRPATPRSADPARDAVAVVCSPSVDIGVMP
ncbi:hypothetical protein RKD30_005351 [Streptomyces pristinaespiralis]